MGKTSVDDIKKRNSDTAGGGSGVVDEYRRAACFLLDYKSETGFEFPAERSVIRRAADEFTARYSPEILAALPDERVLATIFYTAGDNRDALCYWLEKNADCREYFGSIEGGSAYKFGLFQKQETGEWMTGSPNKPQVLDADEALRRGKEIRDALVEGVRILRCAQLNTLEDYEQLDDDLKAGMGEAYYSLVWVHKYLAMVCPDRLSCFFSSKFQYHMLYSLRIRPSEKVYARSGQLAMVENYAGWCYHEFANVLVERFGRARQFIRLGSSDDGRDYAGEWSRNSVIGIGWAATGALDRYKAGDGMDRDAVAANLKLHYFPADARIASRKAGELIRFFHSDRDSVFVVMKGEKLLAMVDGIGSYFYDDSSDMAHKKPGTWHHCFEEDEKLPVKSEGLQTSCVQFSEPDNLMYLYEKYYYGLEDAEEDAREDAFGEEEVMEVDYFVEPQYDTGFVSGFENNRIVFGAPGTGKSYRLKQEAEKLVGCASHHMERVTFHTDYTYSQFVGAYKPVSGYDGRIRYEFVPGPFMRVYVEAVRNGQQIVRASGLIERAEVMHLFPTNPNPSGNDEKWDLFEEITAAGQTETFRASKDSRPGDLALIYVAKTKPGYENGIYAIGTIIEKQGESTALIRFDYVSYRVPIIDYETLKEYSPNVRSTGRVSDDIVRLVKETPLPANPYLLIIEEINRARAAAVFGDVFQLLDRDEDGVSEYAVHASEDVRRYLAAELKGEPKNWTQIKLPDNLFIWATMNSADQGVFSMDTAFKRRWNFEYLGINENDSEIRGRVVLGSEETQEVEWNILRRAVNDKLAKEYKINEDKLMGPFFLSKKVLETVSGEDDTIADAERFKETFKSKVIMYLYEDAAKQYKHKLFAGCGDTTKYSAVCGSFDRIGIRIFGEDFETAYYNAQKG